MYGNKEKIRLICIILFLCIIQVSCSKQNVSQNKIEQPTPVIQGDTAIVLPIDIHNSWMISERFYDHMKFLDIKPDETDGTAGTFIEGYICRFKNIHKVVLK